MTDKNLIDLTNEDIISSLKMIATTRNCNECKIRNCKWGTCNCEQITANAALDLIKCLQSENEDLFYKLTGVMHSVDKWLDGDELKQDEVNRAATMREKTLQIVENLQSENERLEKETKDKERAYNDEFCLRKEWKTKCQELLEEKQTARSEAYKEFTEKLKEFMHNRFKALDEYEFEYITERDINNFIKEMVGEDNG